MPLHSTTLIGPAALAVSLVAWQSGLIVQKFLVATSNVGSVMLIQLGAAAAIMWMCLAIAGRLPRPSLRGGLHIAWGMMAPGLVFTLGIAGAARTDGVSIALIWGLYPLLGAVVARVLLGERLDWGTVAGCFLSLVGIALLTLSRAEGGVSDMAGNALVLASVFGAALSVVVGRALNRGPSRWLQLATLQVTGATVVAAMLTLVTGLDTPDLSQPQNLAGLGYLVLVMTVGNYLAFNLALSRMPAKWFALNSSLGPIVGMVSAWLILGSTITSLDIACAALIIGGVVFPHAVPLIRGPAAALQAGSRDADAGQGPP